MSKGRGFLQWQKTSTVIVSWSSFRTCFRFSSVLKNWWSSGYIGPWGDIGSSSVIVKSRPKAIDLVADPETLLKETANLLPFYTRVMDTVALQSSYFITISCFLVQLCRISRSATRYWQRDNKAESKNKNVLTRFSGYSSLVSFPQSKTYAPVSIIIL